MQGAKSKLGLVPLIMLAAKLESQTINKKLVVKWTTTHWEGLGEPENGAP